MTDVSRPLVISYGSASHSSTLWALPVVLLLVTSQNHGLSAKHASLEVAHSLEVACNFSILRGNEFRSFIDVRGFCQIVVILQRAATMNFEMLKPVYVLSCFLSWRPVETKPFRAHSNSPTAKNETSYFVRFARIMKILPDLFQRTDLQKDAPLEKLGLIVPTFRELCVSHITRFLKSRCLEIEATPEEVYHRRDNRKMTAWVSTSQSLPFELPKW
jgi:hypothetical protein